MTDPQTRKSEKPFRLRLANYTDDLRSTFRPKYAFAYAAAHCFPKFSVGPIIVRLYRFAGFRIGHGTSFMGPVRILSGTGFAENLDVGTMVVISNDVTINVDDQVTIGDMASIGPFVRIYTGTHPIGPGSRRMMPVLTSKPVTIGRGAWIGLGVTVLPGVTIGDGCVIGAGSVVTSDIEAHTYAEGNPAVSVRSLPWSDR